jgi:twitching motility protein PilJ
VVLASTMAQRVTQIRAGGATARLAGDALKRDTDVFENVLGACATAVRPTCRS